MKRLLYILLIGFLIGVSSCKEDSPIAEKHTLIMTGVVFAPNQTPSVYIAMYDNTLGQYVNVPYSKDVFKLDFDDISKDSGATFILIYCDGNYYSM